MNDSPYRGHGDPSYIDKLRKKIADLEKQNDDFRKKLQKRTWAKAFLQKWGKLVACMVMSGVLGWGLVRLILFNLQGCAELNPGYCNKIVKENNLECLPDTVTGFREHCLCTLKNGMSIKWAPPPDLVRRYRKENTKND